MQAGRDHRVQAGRGRRGRVGRGVAGAMALVLALAACGGSDDSDGSSGRSSGGGGGAEQLTGEIVIDAPLSLTGAAAFAGLSERSGMELAVEEINESGILGDATLKVNFVDVAVSADQATAAVRAAASSDAVAVAGITVSNHAPAVAPLAQQQRIPLVIANSGGLSDVTQVGDHVYHMDVSGALERVARSMAEVLQEAGVETTALIINDDAASETVQWEVYERVFDEVGIEITDEVAVPSTTTDYSAAVTNAMSDDPDAIAIRARAASGTAAIAGLRQAGYEGLLYGGQGFAGGIAVDAAPTTEGLIFTANAVPGSPYPTMEQFFDAYEERFDEPGYAFAAQGYDAIWVIARAIEASGCGSRECVQDGLQEIMETGYEGALGELTFEERNAQGPGVIVEIKDGVEVFRG